jgi:lupus La protein
MTEGKINVSNGNSGKETPSGAGPSKHNAIISQIEYYFGDINLPRDKFLQEEMKKDDGWVPLDTMIKFNRLAKLTTDLDEIAKALHNSNLVEVSDDSKKIKRNPEVPLPENTLEYWQEIKHRTVYLKGFPQDTTLDEIQEFVDQYGVVKNVLMRRTKTENDEPRVFKGSVFVTFADLDTAKKLASIQDLKYKDIPLVNKMQDQHFVDKKSEIKKRKDAAKVVKHVQKNKIIQEQTIGRSQPERVKGSLLKVSGFPKNTRFEIVKEYFLRYGKVNFVRMTDDETDSGTQSFYLRFDSENSAGKAWEKAVAAATDGKVLYEENELKGEVLEDGEEADKYWENYSKTALAAAEKMNEIRNSRKNKGGGRNTQQNRQNKRRNDRQDDERSGKKAKRIVFEDADEADDGEEAGNEA